MNGEKEPPAPKPESDTTEPNYEDPPTEADERMNAHLREGDSAEK